MKSQNSFSIVSGGQTGVDRAALDYALSNGLICSGWCPKGRMAEDGFINPRYTLSETSSADPKTRTEMNVLESDATLIIYNGEMDSGTRLTKDLAFEYRRPLFVWRIGTNTNINQFKRWLQNNQVQTLNIAGPRASNAADIYGETLDLLDVLLDDVVRSTDKRMF